MLGNAIRPIRSSNQDTELARRELEGALRLLSDLVIDGLHHGHFTLKISSVVGNKGKRLLTIEAGKSYQLVIPAEALGN